MGHPLAARTRRAWCLFQSGSRPYAVRLDAVAEVVEADGLIRLPLCPPRVLGLLALRRDVVPVLQMNEGQADIRRGADTRIVVLILRTEHGVWGIQVDRGTAVGVEETPIDPGEPFSGGQQPGNPETIAKEGSTYAVIEPELAWRDVRETIEGWYGTECGRVIASSDDAAGDVGRAVSFPPPGLELERGPR